MGTRNLRRILTGNHAQALMLLILVITAARLSGSFLSTVHATAELPNKDELRGMLIDVTESSDLQALGQVGLDNYVDSLYVAEHEMPWAAQIPADLLRDYVIPVRFNPSYASATAYRYPEKINNWRTPLYVLAKDIVGSISDPEVEAQALHRWVNENIPYLAQNQPEYLQPTLILERKGGSCWHNAILLAAFYRSIFLPARVVVGASYWSETATASGTAIPGKDLELVVMEGFWISRDWQIWDREFLVYDQTSGSYLTPNDYSTSIKTIDAAGKERLALKIAASHAADHSFQVSFRYAFPQGHEWVEVWIPEKGWMSADGTDRNGFDVGLKLWPGFFDMQAYNPSSRVWVSSYFFYRFSQPVETLLTTTKTILDEARTKGQDVTLATHRLTQAEEYYDSIKGKILSYDERQRAGEYIYSLCGAASLDALSNDHNSVFMNIWDGTANPPSNLADALGQNTTRNVGTILPYNVFDLRKVKELYAPGGKDPPYVNEVKREYYWLDSFRSELAKGTNLYVMILGCDPISKQWKSALSIADPSKPLESARIISEYSTQFMFKIDGSPNDWTGFEPIVSDPKGDSKKGTLDTDLKAVYAVADDSHLYVMIEVWGTPDPGNNYVFPVDTNGDSDWDYSFGFNSNSAWMYDLRGVPNGQWPQDKESTLDASYAVGNVAEIAIPLGLLRHSTMADMLAWIYYPSLRTTVDDTGWGKVAFIKSGVITTTTAAETQVTRTTTVTPTSLATVTAPTSTEAPTGGAGWLQTNLPYLVVLIAVTGIALILLILRRRRSGLG